MQISAQYAPKQNRRRNCMICKKCGWKIYDKAVVCPHCGAPTENAQQKKPVKKKNKSSVNGFAIAGAMLGVAGFIVSIALISGSIIFIFLPILGIIFSALGLVKAKTLKNGSGLAVIGLIFSILGFSITAFVWIYVLVTVNTL